MKKLLSILLIISLVGCSQEALISDAEKEVFEQALKNVSEAEAISLSLEERKDSKLIEKDAHETSIKTSFVAYRNQDALSDLDYTHEERLLSNHDFIQSDEHQIVLVKEGRLEGEPLDKELSTEDLSLLNIYFLEILDTRMLEEASVKKSKGKMIYTMVSEEYHPILDLKDTFKIDQSNDPKIIEYTFVLENDAISNVTLIYEYANSKDESTVNISLTIHALNDEVDIQYID